MDPLKLLKFLGIPGTLLILIIWQSYEFGLTQGNKTTVAELKGKVDALLFMERGNIDDFDIATELLEALRGGGIEPRALQ